jgi:translin
MVLQIISYCHPLFHCNIPWVISLALTFTSPDCCTFDLKDVLADHPDLYYSGMVYNSVSEYVEAYVTYKLIVEKKMPSMGELGVHYVPYLQGLGDVVGELRRHVLALLDRSLLDEAEYYLDIMERIYLWLRKLNYPDALVPGLRHKVDVARRLIDDTRVLIINTRNAVTVSSRIDEVLKNRLR